ncbi:MAG: response regulator, partial [Desulfamplus sp.]|nr:response regulator [Desulfamplus sp.]
TGFTPGSYVMLSVSDNGCGMNSETVYKIFEPFFTTKEVGKGTGLGLATVYGIIKKNKGFINVYSEPGIGTTFRIYLPIHRNSRYEGEKVENTQPLRADFGQETIMLVEDNTDMLETAATILEHLGYIILSASTPAEAILMAEKHQGKIEMVITDVVMPQMNGRELAENLLFSYPHLKILFMSGYTEDAIVHHRVLDENVHFLEKPFSVEKLTNKVKEVLSKDNSRNND